MVVGFYGAMFLASLALMIVYMFMWHKHFNALITLVFVLVPVINLGYVLFANAQSLEAALTADKLTFIGGCYLQLIVMFTVFSLCDIKLPRWLRVAFLVLSTVVFLSSLTIGDSDIFYTSVDYQRSGEAVMLIKKYGLMHAVFYVMVVLYFLLSIGAMVYSYYRKHQVSRKIIYLLLLPEVIAVVSFFGGRQIISSVELLPAAYVVALVTYLVIVYRMCLYDVAGTAIESLVQVGNLGFASFDFKLNYLGSNAAAKRILPAFNELTVDRSITVSAAMEPTVLTWLIKFAQDEGNNEFHYEKDDKIYRAAITYLYNGRRKKGYQLFLDDDTESQRYIKLLDEFNSELQCEVDRKTAHIVEMHDKLVLGMATMVEGRDNSTGGHIRRTSAGVRLLIAEMPHEEGGVLTDKFCRNVIKAAPMHDLGKIAVDDAVLRKPGRFTPEEFEKMKAHAAEGARIVHEILEGTDDEEFQRIAENVAHYHHERWDGSGYPEGLRGEEIPLEARIMAIADVYDALVSKRVYKEAMSFEKADAIIMEGMGSQFDKGLEPYYQAARPKLERFYTDYESCELPAPQGED